MTAPRAAARPAVDPSDSPLAAPGGIRDLLRTVGLRGTAQRAAILELLELARRGDRRAGVAVGQVHLTAAEIHERLVARGAALDLATVHRNLATLSALGVIHAIGRAPNLTTYGLTTAAHHHAVCTRCGALVDIPATALTDAMASVAEATGFAMDESALTIRGVCQGCRAAGR